MQQFEMNRRQFLGTFSAFLAGLAGGGASGLVSAVSGVEATASSAAALALPLIARNDALGETVRSLSALLHIATPSDPNFAGSSDVFDFHTSYLLHPLVTENRFFFPQPAQFAELLRVLHPAADLRLRPAGALEEAHVNFVPWLGDQSVSSETSEDWNLRAYLKGGPVTKAPPEIDAIVPTDDQRRAWSELKDRGLKLIEEIRRSPAYADLSQREAAHADAPGKGKDLSFVVESLRRYVGVLMRDREPALEAFRRDPPFVDAQAWRYLQVFSNPGYVAELANDQEFLARGRCARAFIELLRQTKDVEEYPRLRQSFLSARREVESRGIKFPDEWQARFEKVERIAERARHAAQNGQETPRLELPREKSSAIDDLLCHSLPSTWRRTGLMRVTGDFELGASAARITLRSDGWRLRVR